MNAYQNLASSYDRLTNDVDYAGWVDFAQAILEKEGLKPRTVADLACGTGSATRILAERGYRVTAVDLSEDMLTEAMDKCADLPNLPTFVHQNLAQLKLRAMDGQVFLDEDDDVYCVWRGEFDEDTNICSYGMDLFQRDGEVWHRSFEEHQEYAYSIEQLKTYLKNAGFTHIKVWADREFTAPREGEQRVWFQTRKGVVRSI